MKNRIWILFTVASFSWLAACGRAAAVDPAATGAPAASAAIDTAAPSKTGAATNTLVQTAAVTTAGTLLPTAALIPTKTSTPKGSEIPCYWANFVGDITAPDDWQIAPKTAFTKTWRLGNIGRCAWNSDFKLVFVEGDRMGAPNSQTLTTKIVASGETVDVSVDLVSPGSLGVYQGFFMIRAPDGAFFGIGAHANSEFWVKIQIGVHRATPGVTPPTQIVTQEISIAADDVQSLAADCPKGTVVTGGGFSVSDASVQVYESYMAGNGWFVNAINSGGDSQNLTVTAVCLSLSSVTATQLQANFAFVDASPIALECPGGSVATGGGYSFRSAERTRFFITANFQSLNGWQLMAQILDAKPLPIGEFAVCLYGVSATEDPVSASTTIAPGEDGFVAAECPAGDVLTGGGWGATGGLAVSEASVFGKTWRVRARNAGSTKSEELQSRPVCLAFQ
jgi:hypothetical protein